MAKGDERFNFENFQNLPQWIIRQAVASIESRRNMDNYTQARMLQAYHNSHIDEKTPAITDLSLFMPHPHQWIIQNSERKVQVSRQAAILFLQTYKDFGTEVIATFDSWVRDLEIIAAGG